MTVDPAKAKAKVEHGGTTYYFCCSGCAQKFQAAPERYLVAKASGLVTLGAPQKHSSEMVGIVPARAATATKTGPAQSDSAPAYVCPMCPEVRESKPGPCPSCGMALEPENPQPLTTTEYTCPMHPDIVRTAPGTCPICGMALEPRTIAAEQDNPELRDMTRRFWISLLLTAPLLAIAMSDMLPNMPVQHGLPNGWLAWIELILATPVVLWGG
jgi:Cu+-exporting ATPase